jgi:hypothetical protein
MQVYRINLRIKSSSEGNNPVENSHFWGPSVELGLSYGRRSVYQFVLVSGSPLGPMTRFYPYPFFSNNCLFSLPVVHPLWREDGSVTYNAIADWSGHWGPITIHYRLIWDCVPSSSPLMTRWDCGGGILTCLYMGSQVLQAGENCTYICVSWPTVWSKAHSGRPTQATIPEKVD